MHSTKVEPLFKSLVVLFGLMWIKEFLGVQVTLGSSDFLLQGNLLENFIHLVNRIVGNTPACPRHSAMAGSEGIL